MKEKLNLFHGETISNLKYMWKVTVIFMHGYIKWYLWAFYFLLQSKCYHKDVVLMVVMPSGYDKKIPLMLCDERKDRVHFPEIYSRGSTVSF